MTHHARYPGGMLLGRAMMLLARGHSFMPVIEFAEWRRWFSASR
jgi:hypothetical protein